MTSSSTDPTADLDPDFTFDFTPLDDPPEGQRFSNYWDLEPLMRGPQPVPDWVVTDRAASTPSSASSRPARRPTSSWSSEPCPRRPGGGVLMAAKRYRGAEHRAFHRNARYTEGRRVRKSPATRGRWRRRRRFGRQVAAGQWAAPSGSALVRCWSAGVPVPYPVQIDGTEILMECIAVDGGAAPRLAQARPEAALLRRVFEQLATRWPRLARPASRTGTCRRTTSSPRASGWSIIDLPQVVDIVGNPQGVDFLQRDCRNVCRGSARRGLDVDEHELFGELRGQGAW